MDPFYLYLSGLIVGGIAILSSLVGGDDLGDSLGEGLHFLAFLRLRFLFFFAFFFGLTGLLGTLLMGPTATALTAAGTGLLCAFVGDWTLGRLSHSSAGNAFDTTELVGMEAEVTVPIAAAATGKISGAVQGRTIELLARASKSDQSLAAGAQVLVLEVDDGVALVDLMG